MNILALALVLVFSILSFLAKKIDAWGSVVGGFIAYAIFLGGSWGGLLLLFTFFVLGSLASSWKYQYKYSKGLAEKNKGQRTAVNAYSNGGIAALCGILGAIFPENNIYPIMLAGSLAAATSDTLSSELGNVYGRKFINILNLKPGVRGQDGVISLEGTLIGLLGSAVIGLSYGATTGHYAEILPIVLAGFSGNIMDSILGASAQRWGWLDNHGVNLLNTLFAALCAGGYYMGRSLGLFA